MNHAQPLALACSVVLLAAGSPVFAQDTPPTAAVSAPSTVAPAAAPLPAPPVATAPSPAAGSLQAAADDPNNHPGFGPGPLPVYGSFLVAGAAFHEDSDDRLTTRSSRTLESFGLVTHLGANLDEHHRLGARFQSLVRPTKAIARDTPYDPAISDSRWGTIVTGHIGPEYMLLTDAGVYGAASVGLGYAFSTVRRSDCAAGSVCAKDDARIRDRIERGTVGFSGVVSLGYQWRSRHMLTANAEVFGGLYRGFRDEDRSVNNSTFGLAVGFGI